MQLIEIGDARVIHISPNDSVDHAIELMEQNNFRHLPVVDRGRVVGMVSDRDLLSAVAMLPNADRAAGAEGPARIGATRITQIMSTPAVTVDAEAPLDHAAAIMLRENIRAVPLVYKDRLAGIVTETDFLKCYLDDRPITKRQGWRLMKVGDRMSAPVVTLESKEHFLQALRTMQSRKIRHLPIVDDGNLVGIVSDRDMRRAMGGLRIAVEDARAQQHRPHTQIVMSDIMSRDVLTTSPAATLAEAADVLVANKFGSLPVLQSQALVGIITESDLLRHFLNSCKG